MHFGNRKHRRSYFGGDRSCKYHKSASKYYGSSYRYACCNSNIEDDSNAGDNCVGINLLIPKSIGNSICVSGTERFTDKRAGNVCNERTGGAEDHQKRTDL